MLKLFIFPPCWGMPSPSPFCIKVEAYLKVAGIAYEVTHVTDPREGPKGKLPYIVTDSSNHSETIGDSHLIINYLESQQKKPLDQFLSSQQKAISLVTKRMLDEHFVWAIVYSRWVPDKNFKIIKNTFFANAFGPLKKIVSKKVRKTMLDALSAQGLSRHSETEIYQFAQEDIIALAELLGEQDYFFGAQPSILDTTAYAYLASIIHAPMESPLKRLVLEQANLVSLCERIDEQYFKDS